MAPVIVGEIEPGIEFDPDKLLAQIEESRDWRADYQIHRRAYPITGKNLCAYLAFCEEKGIPVDERAVGKSLDFLVLTNRLAIPSFWNPPQGVQPYAPPTSLN